VPDTIAARVARGAALLDEKLPGWADRIDLDRLDLASPCRCVLGQLWLDKPLGDHEDPFDAAMGDLDLGFSEPSRFGFDRYGHSNDTEYMRLDAAWRELIESRRAGS
jgi:hypothetical protein